MQWSEAINIIIMLMIGVIGYLLKTDRQANKEMLQQHRTDIEKLDQRIDTLEKELPFVYVTREEYIRQTAMFDKKLDKVYEAVTERRSS